MPSFVQQALERKAVGAPHWLDAVHQRGRNTSAGLALPNIKVEDWKYTSLRALDEGRFVGTPVQPDNMAEVPACFTVDGLDAYRLVFVNGIHAPMLSSGGDLPEGLTLVAFSAADDLQTARIKANLGSLAASGERLFTALNDSWVSDGVYLKVGRNVTVDKPVHLVWLTTPQAEPAGIAQRLFVELEEGSEVSVIEHFTSSAASPTNAESGENTFTTGVSEFVVGDNARLNHCRFHLEQASALHIGTVQVNLGRASTLNGFHLALGSVLKRIDLKVRMLGEGAHSELNGVYLPRDRQVVDYHTCLEHEVPNCTSEETFRGIIADRARAVFNGRIHIHRDAQKTSAHLSNRNLLTSDKAEVDTKPELEIYADDVQCSHGATVAQLDEKQMYYLRTRGVSEQEARVLLSFGFINEILNRIKIEPLRDYLRPQLAGLFATDPNLTRHLL